MELGVFSRTYQPVGIDKIFAQIAHDGFQTIQFNFSSAGLPSLPKDWPEARYRVDCTVDGEDIGSFWYDVKQP